MGHRARWLARLVHPLGIHFWSWWVDDTDVYTIAGKTVWSLNWQKRRCLVCNKLDRRWI